MGFISIYTISLFTSLFSNWMAHTQNTKLCLQYFAFFSFYSQVHWSFSLSLTLSKWNLRANRRTVVRAWTAGDCLNASRLTGRHAGIHACCHLPNLELGATRFIKSITPPRPTTREINNRLKKKLPEAYSRTPTSIAWMQAGWQMGIHAWIHVVCICWQCKHEYLVWLP